MRIPRIVVALLCAALTVGAGAASAELGVKEVQWQIPAPAKGGRKTFQSLEKWVQAPTARPGVKPRALVTLVNRGPKPAEGLVLCYAVAARLVKIGEPQKEGVWTVPFWREERRVPWVNANQTKDVPLDQMVLDIFLKRTFRAGYWPDALRIQVMVEPREGNGPLQGVTERVLPVASTP